MTLSDYIFATYNELLNSGWHMNDIDGMDMLGFLQVRAWKARKDEEKAKPKAAYIDDVWKSMKPGRR